MSLLLIAILAVALVASVLALTREIRLRRALARLLRYVLSHWRTHDPKTGDPVDSAGESHRRL